MNSDAIGEEVAWVTSQNVMVTDIGEGLALLDLRTNEYFSLNEVGAFVWEVLRTPTRRGEIIRAVTENYDVAPDACSADIDRLLEELANASLAERRAGSAA